MDHTTSLSTAISRADTLLHGSVVPTLDVLQDCYDIAENIAQALKERKVPAGQLETVAYNHETEDAMNYVKHLCDYQQDVLCNSDFYETLQSIDDLKQLNSTPIINLLGDGRTELDFGHAGTPIFDMELVGHCSFLNTEQQWKLLSNFVQENNIIAQVTVPAPHYEHASQDIKLSQPFANELYIYPTTFADMQDNDRSMDNLTRDLVDTLASARQLSDPDEVRGQYRVVQDIFERLDEESQNSLLHQLQIYAHECKIAGKDFYAPEDLKQIAGIEQVIETPELALA